MKKVKKMIRHVSEKTAYSSVGKSIALLLYETKIPDEVKKWVKMKRVM